MRGDCRSSVSSFKTLAPGSISGLRCWAWAGAAKAMRPAIATAPAMKRARANRPVMAHPPVALARPHGAAASFAWRSHRYALAIGGHPAPRPRAVTTLDHALPQELGHELALSPSHPLGRA